MPQDRPEDAAMDRVSEAQAIIEGGDASAAELQLLARELRDAGPAGSSRRC
jgi:hypothetical protein